MKQEKIEIVEVLREYRNTLLCASITIYADHKNLLSNAQVASW